jgi:hypothetical protein
MDTRKVTHRGGSGPAVNLNTLLIIFGIVSTILTGFASALGVVVVVVWRGATIEAVIETVREAQTELQREQRLQGIDIGTLKSDVAVLKSSTERNEQKGRTR